MNSDIKNYIVRGNQKQWEPLIEKGIQYEGVWIKALLADLKEDRCSTILLKFDPGAGYPYHNHPGGEEIYVLSGEAIIENVAFREGDYLFTPPGYKHSVKSETGCILFLRVPEEVEIL